jgi:hypothetical protein
MHEARDAGMRRILDELEANRKSRRTAWATLQRLRKFLEANGARIKIPDDRSFKTEAKQSSRGFAERSQDETRFLNKPVLADKHASAHSS